MNDSVKSFDMQAKLKRAVHIVAHALYPTRCAGCGTVLPINHVFCDACAKDIRPLQPNLCNRCLNPPSRCDCDTLTPEYERAFAPFCYAGTIRNALLDLKDEKNSDLALGNCVGSCIFNVFFVLGITSCISPLAAYKGLFLDAMMSFLAPLMVLLFVCNDKKKEISRLEGGVLLMVYAGYLGFRIFTL